MNNYYTITTFYLRPSRTIETVLLKNAVHERILYVYNYEGWHFRVFNNVMDLMNFFDDKFEPEVSFENNDKLDNYLGNLDLDSNIFDIKIID